ncbi:MAG: hypothetical protein IPG50_25085 [Myxococcales bacterium]|nr:hypothetical protein [Myxococcales bacterium]
MRVSRLPCFLALAAAAGQVLGCGDAIRRFPLRAPMSQDVDAQPFAPAPEEYVSPFAWDGANQMVFRPMARFFAVDPAGEAVNVNAFDEVPDSSWFANRIGKTADTTAAATEGARAWAPDDVALGSCIRGKVLDPEGAADGTWLIDQGKPNGANPGFRVKAPQGKFMLKADLADQPERATAAAAIAARFYHAFGFHSPCDSVVYYRRGLLTLKPGLSVTDNSGVTKPFDAAALDAVLAKASRRGDRMRMGVSKWLPGKPLGPFTYEGKNSNDPNDVIPHEDRRELRGGRLLAAWLNHFDSREQNSMNVWMPTREDDPKSPGYVKHFYLDLGDCFGSEWAWEGISKRLGHAYYFDFGYTLEDFATLGIVTRPWDRARRSDEGSIFGYFSERDFDPEMWRGGYPNPAFGRMQERDGAWAARIIARFSNEDIEAAVKVGDFSEPKHAAYLTRTLVARRDAILSRYLRRLSPLADVAVRGEELCATDLARKTLTGTQGPLDPQAFQYVATARMGRGPGGGARVLPDGGVCLPLAHQAPDADLADDHVDRYVVVDLKNGDAQGPLRAHLYDLGPARGFRLVGIERPPS